MSWCHCCYLLLNLGWRKQIVMTACGPGASVLVRWGTIGGVGTISIGVTITKQEVIDTVMFPSTALVPTTPTSIQTTFPTLLTVSSLQVRFHGSSTLPFYDPALQHHCYWSCLRVIKVGVGFGSTGHQSHSRRVGIHNAVGISQSCLRNWGCVEAEMVS